MSSSPAWTHVCIGLAILFFVAMVLIARPRRSEVERWWHKARKHPSVATAQSNWTRDDLLARLLVPQHIEIDPDTLRAMQSAYLRARARGRWRWHDEDWSWSP